jgi:hypothetical protein
MPARATILATTVTALSIIGLTTAVHANDATRGNPSLEARLQRLEDREAILDLLVTYGRLLDKQDLVAYSKLFAVDGVWEGGIGSAQGPESIRQMLERVYGRVTPGQYGSSYHIMSDFIINVAGDTASSFSRWTWVVEGADGKPVLQRSGHYEDKLVKQGGQWRFKHRLTVTELPTRQKDSEAQIFRRDHRDRN